VRAVRRERKGWRRSSISTRRCFSNLPNNVELWLLSAERRGSFFRAADSGDSEVRDLYSFAKSRGITVIVLTAATNRAVTRHPRPAGRGILRLGRTFDAAKQTPTGEDYKAVFRQDVEKKGYKIILNIGDQLSDLIGGHSERTYKLPNPFYFVE